MDCRSGNDNDDFLYLDPKLLKRGDTLPKTRAPFQDAIVFIVGSGNYIEYQNLADFIKVSSSKTFYNSFLKFQLLINKHVFIDYFSKSKPQTQINESFMERRLCRIQNNSSVNYLCWARKLRISNLGFFLLLMSHVKIIKRKCFK